MRPSDFYEEDEEFADLVRRWSEGRRLETADHARELRRGQLIRTLGVGGVLGSLVGAYVALFTPLFEVAVVLCVASWVVLVVDYALALRRSRRTLEGQLDRLTGRRRRDG